MADVKPPITFQQVKDLKSVFVKLYDEDLKPKKGIVFSEEVKQFNEMIKQAGISIATDPRVIEREIERWYEWYENTTPVPENSESTTTEVPAPEGLNQTTISERTNEAIFRDNEKLKEQIAKTRVDAKVEINRAIKRKQEIIREQQKNEEQLRKIESIRVETEKLKPLYVKLDKTEKVVLTSDESKVFNEFKEEAIKEPEETKIKIARTIHERADEVLKEEGLSSEEAELAVNQTAEKIVETFKVIDRPDYVPPIAAIAINDAVYKKTESISEKVISTQTKNVLLNSIGTTTKYRFLPDVFLAKVTETAFGPAVSKTLFGTNYKVTISDSPTTGSNYTFNYSFINESSKQIYSEQNQTLEAIKGLGEGKAKEYLVNQSAAYFARSTIGQKVLTNTGTQVAFYSVFKGAGKNVVWSGTGTFGNLIVNSGYEPIVYLTTGEKFVSPMVTLAGGAIGRAAVARAAAATYTSVVSTGGIMAAEAFAGGAGAAAGATAGSAVAPILGTAIGAAIGYVSEKLFSRIKIWWNKNKDSFGPGLGLGAGIFGALFFGAGAGVGIGFGVLAATGSLSTFVISSFNLLSFIGRSAILTITTPVIATLITIPLLIAFIMLVINNSAYVVPYSDSRTQGGVVDEECLGPVPEKPVVTDIRFSADKRYAYPVAPFEVPGYACYHWDKNKAADIFSPQNKPPMVAYESGVVVNVILNDSLGGKYIILRGTTSGRHYYYAHLCQVFVENGEEVKVGDVMATMDETGSGRVQHLHYAINSTNLGSEFIGGDGDICPQKDFEEKFGFGVCNTSNYCINP